MPPLVLVVVSWVLGLLIAHEWLVPYEIQPVVVAILCLLPLGALACWWKDRPIRVAGFCALALLLGSLRYQRAEPGPFGPDDVAYYNDHGWASAQGMIVGYPDRRDTSSLLQMDASTLEIEGQAHGVHGTILVQAQRFPEYRFGDLVRASGLLKTPPELEGFSYRQYLAHRGIFSVLQQPRIELLASGKGSRFWAALYGAKDRLRLTISKLMSAPESALMQGIVLGIRSEIPKEIVDEFNTTSTSHLLVISGANVVIVSALLAGLMGRLLGRRRGYWTTMAGLAGYVLLVGAEMPVVRAGIMGGLYLTGRYLGRGTMAYVSLCAAALLLTAASPWALWDTSFQLSFLATAGLILLAGPLKRFLDRRLGQKVANPRVQALTQQLSEVIALTLAPQVMVLPLLATSFGQLSLVSPVANILVAPAQPFIMTWGCASTLLGLFPWLLPLARIAAWVPWLLLAYTKTIVHWTSGWPAASVPVSSTISLWLAGGIYGGLGVLAWIRRRGPTRSRAASLAGALPGRTGLSAALLAVAMLWITIDQLPDRRLHVAFLDVGQGDAILITTPHQQQILIDGGPSPATLLSALGEQLPSWDHSLDLVVSTHTDSDHLTGLLAVLERYEVGGWIDNGVDTDEPLARECLLLLRKDGVRRHVAVAGDRFDLGDGTSLEVISPPRTGPGSGSLTSNNASIVLLLRHGSHGFLLTGDIEAEAEQILIGGTQQLHADVLKVAHHGSAGSTTDEFLDAVAPTFAVISVGANNWSGHPAPETLERLANLRGLVTFRTDVKGTVELVSDGWQLQAETER